MAGAPGSIEFFVVGTGEKMALLPRLLTAALREAGLRVEAMATGPPRASTMSCSENRRVAAALDRRAVTAGGPSGGALAEAHTYCAGLAREHARDQWLGSLYAAPSARDALLGARMFRL